MYTRYSKLTYRRNYIQQLTPGVDDKIRKVLYEERIRLFEILDVCLDMSTYLLALSLRATSKIDKHAHLHVNDGLVEYGRVAMQEMLVIRIREFFQAEKDKPERFKLHGFHQTLHERGIANYPMPNLETNNAIARIIHRRSYYSAHHGDGKKEHSFTKNRLNTSDLMVAMSYMAKIEENLHSSKAFDPFERLLNDELNADRPLTLCDVYEVVTGQDYEVLNYSRTLETRPNGDQIVDGDYEDTPEFVAYTLKAKQEIQKVKLKVQKIIDQ